MLLQYNLERFVSPEILPGECFAFTIPPAIVVVLYAMADVYTPVLVPEWRSQQQLAALFAVRQSMVHSMEKYVASLSEGLNRYNCQDELEQSMEKIRLVRLQRQLQPTSKDVFVPMVNGEAIMINDNLPSLQM